MGKKRKYKFPKKYKALVLLRVLNRQDKNKRISLKNQFKYTLYIKQAFKLFYGNLKEKTLKKFCINLIHKNNKLTKIINFFRITIRFNPSKIKFCTKF